MAEIIHTNPGKAVELLMRNVPPEDVFAAVLKGRHMPIMGLHDLAIHHLESPASRDPKKPIIGALLTAATIDVALAMRRKQLVTPVLEFALNERVDDLEIELSLVPLLRETRKVVASTGADFKLGLTNRPHFDGVFKSLEKYISPDHHHTLLAIGGRVEFEGDIFIDAGVDYQSLLTKVFTDKVKRPPTYGELLDLVESSLQILTIPASKDLPFTGIVQQEVFERGKNGRSTSKYISENYYLDTSGEPAKVVVKPEVRVKMERRWKSEQPWNKYGKQEDPVQITGCPALHGGLIKEAILFYTNAVRTATREPVVA